MAPQRRPLYELMAGKQEWMVILPDKKDALADRMKVRPDHLAALKPSVESGFWVMGGASLDEPVKEGEGPKINGSVMMAVAESKDEVLEKIKADVYYTSGVWDVEKIQIFPFKSS
ncbi:hypothetical protein B0A55_03661 [Friedmanniomyces simplex]|uniref:YCII-related domain-containing protein n=1 Tax=Friedmanniomyces simplex TaxID=329884 RepID=A0A4U0XQP3_9PEZI|nr:hypothetical protein B0A55_03661 [Friedmanniomyces simplex]